MICKFFSMRYDHRQVFNQLISVFGYSGKQVAEMAGLTESKISRFRTGKLDLEAGELFQALEAMPPEAQDYFWQQFLGSAMPVEKLIRGMNTAQASKLLHAIATSIYPNEDGGSVSDERIAV